MLKCSKCRKPLEKDGTKVIGFQLKVSITKDATEAEGDLMLESLGKYCAYIEDNGNSFEFEINLCYECWIDGLLQGDRMGLIQQMGEQARETAAKKNE